MRVVKRGSGWAGAALVLALACAGALQGRAEAAPRGTVDVTVIAVNDIHGNIDPPPGGIGIADPAHPGMTFSIAANKSLGLIDIRAIAPTLAKIMGTRLPSATGKTLF